MRLRASPLTTPYSLRFSVATSAAGFGSANYASSSGLNAHYFSTSRAVPTSRFATRLTTVSVPARRPVSFARHSHSPPPKPPRHLTVRSEQPGKNLSASAFSFASSSASRIAIGLVLGIGAALSLQSALQTGQIAPEEVVETTEPAVAMSVEVPPGRPGNLTADQEDKLRQLWGLIFQITNVGVDEVSAEGADTPDAPVSRVDTGKGEKAEKTKRKRNLFGRKSKKGAEGEGTPAPSTPSLLSPKEGAELDDKYGQTKHFHETLASQTPEDIRSTIWSMVKYDNPDALVLRFLRARKWDVEKALVMLISSMNWRFKEMHVDDDIMRGGEAAAVEAEASSDAAAKKLGHDFVAQMRMGKSFLHGVDKLGRPLCFVRVRLHKQGEQGEASVERYTVYTIETARMLLRSPVDTATIVFDMTGFTMANMDYTPVKFMIKCFEANYPESLGAVLVHKAPWIFQGIWKIIKGWLDPVVAGKVHFTNNAKDMAEFIPPEQIIKELEGKEDWEWKYPEPVPGENDKMKDTATRDRLLAVRETIVKEYEELTLEWLQEPQGEKADELKSKRNAVAVKLRDDYWNLDPYLRARSYLDRGGIVAPDGKISFYPKAAEQPKVNGTEKAAPVETSADDID